MKIFIQIIEKPLTQGRTGLFGKIPKKEEIDKLFISFLVI